MKQSHYLWNNKKTLKTLTAKGEGDTLIFKTNTEKAEVYLKDGDIEKVIFSYKKAQTVIGKKQRHHIVVGEGNHKRDVYHYLKPNGPAPTMRLGITKHKGVGTWSSLPHDFELNTEPNFEEVFFYLLKGGSKRAIQVGRGVWYDNTNVDTVWPVKDYSFSTIPMGFHPVAGEPDVHVSYVWVYLAKKKEWEKI